MASILTSIVCIKTVSGANVYTGVAYSRVDDKEFVTVIQAINLDLKTLSKEPNMHDLLIAPLFGTFSSPCKEKAKPKARIQQSNVPSTSETDTIESEILTFDYGSIEQQIRQECDVKWVVETIDVSSRFKKYQLRLIRDLKNDHKKHTWNDTTEISALASIIILDWPCRYDTFTSKEWELVTNDNPYKLTRPIFDEQLSSSLNDALIK
ncbi:16704_t:CDS:2 [Entrophospora sp. SA101]|nr:17845_t:CDS:2 [Entrophospora sp. SA101]CAJ0747628.1 16704_t:CDS:2 [Entrophospora sp. SA101]